MFKDYIKFLMARCVYRLCIKFFSWNGYTVFQLQNDLNKSYEDFVIDRHERQVWLNAARKAKGAI